MAFQEPKILMALLWPNIFMALPWPKIFMTLPWPKIFMTLPCPKIFMSLPWPKNTNVKIWSILNHLINFEPISAILIQFDQAWTSLVYLEQVWPSMIQVEHVWASLIGLIKFDQVWTSLIKFDQDHFLKHVQTCSITKAALQWQDCGNSSDLGDLGNNEYEMIFWAWASWNLFKCILTKKFKKFVTWRDKGLFRTATPRGQKHYVVKSRTATDTVNFWALLAFFRQITRGNRYSTVSHLTILFIESTV